MALNIFGQPPEYLSGLLGIDPEKLRKQAFGTGLVNTALAFAAQPRNQGYGSALPYAARALMAGQQGAQGVYQGALQDYMTRQQIEQLKRQQEQQQAQQQYVNQFAAERPELASAIKAYPQLIPDIVKQQIAPPEMPFAKIDPSKYTPESIKQFMENGGRDYSVLVTVDKPQLTEAIKNFEYAKENGYTGSFEDWAKSLSPYQLAQLGIDKAQLDLAIQEATYKYGTPTPPMPKTATMQDVADTARASGKTTQQVINDLKARGITVKGAR